MSINFESEIERELNKNIVIPKSVLDKKEIAFGQIREMNYGTGKLSNIHKIVTKDIHKDISDKKKHKSIPVKIALIAAMVTVISATSVLATNLPAVKNVASTIISHFNNIKDTRYLTDKNSFEKFNKSIGVSSDNKDIKLRVDNIAVDDNFINVFYTVQSKDPIDMKFNDESKLFEAFLSTPFLDFKINGKEITNGNNNDIDAYFEGDKVLKVMRRFNVSQITLPKSFDLEISTNEIFRTKGKWEIATTIDKSEVEVATNTVKPNIKATIDLGDYKHNITIDKVSISPFGCQIVIGEKIKNNRMFNIFALYDDKGNVLDVLNTDTQSSGFGKSTNSFEFVKGNIDMKYITLVPIKLTEGGKAIVDKQSIKNLPITFKTCNTGSRVVDKVDFDKNVIKISYHNEGVELWDPGFQLFDALGNEFNSGDGSVGLNTSVDRQSGEFTSILTFSDKNVDLSKIAKIGTFTGVETLKLLKDQEIKISLNK